MGHQLAGGNSSCCPDLEVWTTHRYLESVGQCWCEVLSRRWAPSATGCPAAPPRAAQLLPSHRQHCHFADAISPSILKHLLKGEGGAAE